MTKRREMSADEIAERLDRPIGLGVSSFSHERDRRMRRSIETERGAAYTDAEWSEAKVNLVEFFGLLVELDLKYSERRR